MRPGVLRDAPATPRVTRRSSGLQTRFDGDCDDGRSLESLVDLGPALLAVDGALPWGLKATSSSPTASHVRIHWQRLG